jgi:hypothetical protein
LTRRFPQPDGSVLTIVATIHSFVGAIFEDDRTVADRGSILMQVNPSIVKGTVETRRPGTGNEPLDRSPDLVQAREPDLRSAPKPYRGEDGRNLPEILRIASQITTPIGLLGLMAALGYYFYARHLKHAERTLDVLPPEERARLADSRLSRYRLDARNLTREQKNDLIAEEMRRRHRFACIVAILGALVFVICFGIAAYTYRQLKPTDPTFGQRGDPPAVAPVDLVAAKRQWSASLARLTPLVPMNQDRDGGFGSTIGDPKRDQDAWTTSQCVTALSAFRIEPEDAAPLANAMQWLTSNRNDDGWSHYSHLSRRTSTEVTAWVGVASEEILKGSGVQSVGPHGDDVARNLATAVALVANRQLPLGAWSSLLIPFPDRMSPANSRGTYATAMAMTLLIRLKRFPSHANILSDDELEQRIGRGLQSILSEFNSGLGGWEASPADGPHDGVTMLNLLVLEEARSGGFSRIDSDRRYLQARHAWIMKWSRESATRHISANFELSQKQDCFSADGQLIDTAEFPVRILWFPWSFYLSSTLASDSSLSQEEHHAAVQIEARLWERLPDAIDDASVGGRFRAAEMVYSLRRIGMLHGWY